MQKVLKLLKIDLGKVDPVLKPIFSRSFISYIFLYIVGIVFYITSKNIQATLFYIALLTFMVVQRFILLKEASDNRLIKITGECNCPQRQNINIRLIGTIQIFGSAKVEIRAQDGHVYIAPLPAFGKFVSGDIVEAYISPSNLGKIDQDTYNATTTLYMAKVKNATFTQT